MQLAYMLFTLGLCSLILVVVFRYTAHFGPLFLLLCSGSLCFNFGIVADFVVLAVLFVPYAAMFLCRELFFGVFESERERSESERVLASICTILFSGSIFFCSTL